MENKIRITSDDNGHHVVTDEKGMELASFTRYPGDWTTGVKFNHGEHTATVEQRHVITDDLMHERIKRIFDDIDLSEEIKRLLNLHTVNRALWHEKSVTTDTLRYKELVQEGVLRTSDMYLEVQRGIVAAKMYLLLGVTTKDLRLLGL